MKNHEGYPDPAANETINGVRREEKQRLLEKKSTGSSVDKT